MPRPDCGLAFFGIDKCLFASDCPFDPEGGPMYIRETIRILDGLEVSDAERGALYLDRREEAPEAQLGRRPGRLAGFPS